jgi:hypothetical protein
LIDDERCICLARTPTGHGDEEAPERKLLPLTPQKMAQKR